MADNKKEKMISVSELFEKSFAVYKTIFWPVIKISLAPLLTLIPVVVLGVLAVLVYYFVPNYSVANTSYIILGILGVVDLAFFIVVMYIARIASLIIVKNNDPKLKLKEAFMMAKSKAWIFLGTSLLATLFIFLWLLLFIIPGIIMSLYYTFVSWIVLEEGLSGSQALKRSKHLVKGYWWDVFGRSILPTIIIGFILGMLSGFMVGEDGSGQASYDFITQIISLVTAPFFLAYSYYMYKSLVNIKNKPQV